MANTKKNKAKAEEINLSNIFEETNNNIVNAKTIFLKNEEIKNEIDLKIKELNKKKIELSKKTKEDYLKIKQYKDEVMNKIVVKKQELDKKMDSFKDIEAKFKAKKEEFDAYKKNELEKLNKEKRQTRNEIETQKKELEALKQEFEKERLKLDADRIQYEMDKNELANNLLKFNELVSDFTVNIDQIKDEK